MHIISTPDYPGRAYEIVGLVSSSATRGRNFVVDKIAGLSDIFGGKTRSYDVIMSGLIGDIYDDLQAQAQSAGADAVIALQLLPLDIGSSKLIGIQAVGTAIRFAQEA